MIRKNIVFTEEQAKWLEGESKKTGLKQSEILRRMVDEYRRKEGKITYVR